MLTVEKINKAIANTGRDVMLVAGANGMMFCRVNNGQPLTEMVGLASIQDLSLEEWVQRASTSCLTTKERYANTEPVPTTRTNIKDEAKSVGFKAGTEVARAISRPIATLTHWYNHSYYFFRVVLFGAAEVRRLGQNNPPFGDRAINAITAAGFKDLAEFQYYSTRTEPTLYLWWRENPDFFRIVLLGASVMKQLNATPGQNDDE
ncbi:hypothetical protein [Edwardsiella tarda]|uniref:hypothetical protein n=1 Tax=Edwardsiella tarda TaxID=636 RepID=UPI000555D57A|nr:hypothetical protein [Edwardsiella tarda]